MKEIVFDIETYGDIKNRDQLKVTMVSLYDYGVGEFRSFVADFGKSGTAYRLQ